MKSVGAYRLTGMALPMVVWAVHFVFVYSVSGLACERGWTHGSWLMLAASALAAVLLVALGWNAWRQWRVQPPPVSAADPLQRRRRFLAGLTLALSVLSALAVAFTTLPVFMLPPCEG
jgi:hypothetical protein